MSRQISFPKESNIIIFGVAFAPDRVPRYRQPGENATEPPDHPLLALDTVLVTPGRRVVIAFDANNPGLWAFHCHLLYHLDAGMFTTLRYV